MISTCFSLVFPLGAVAVGAYLVSRGSGRMVPAECVTGTVRLIEPIQSHASRTDCAYAKTVVDHFNRRYGPWKPVATLESRTRFKVGDVEVDPKHADFRITRHRTWEGYTHLRTFVHEFVHRNVEMRLPDAIIRPVRPDQMIEKQMVENLIADEMAKKAVMGVKNDPLRITEYVLAEGDTITIAIDPAVAKGEKVGSSELHPPIITDSGKEYAVSSMREKAYLSLFAGGFLILAGLAVSAYLLLTAQ